MKALKKTVSIILSAVTIFAAITAIWLIIDKYVIGYPAPRLFGYSFFNVESGSMEEEISVNDLIIVRRTEDYAVNDIVTYMREDEDIPTTHRIVGITSDGKYITKGDANNTNDRFPVNEGDILGEVIKIKKGAGATLVWMQTRGWIYLAGFAILITIASFFFETDDGDEKSVEHEEKNAKKTKGDKNEQDS